MIALPALGCGQTSVDPPGDGGSGGSAGAGGAAACTGEHWRSVAPPTGASARIEHPAVAVNGEVLIWGGRGEVLRRGDGVRVGFEQTPSAAVLPGAGAPAPRVNHALAAIGDSLVIWGGEGVEAGLEDGARLELTQGAWKPMSSKGHPSLRLPLFGVVGTELLVWGSRDTDGLPLTDAAFYDPDLDSWTNAPSAPFALEYNSLLVTAGDQGVFAYGRKSEAISTWAGYFFDAKTRQWKLLPDEPALGDREGAVVAWSPSTKEVLIWGGLADSYQDSGVRFSIPEWKWRVMSSAGAPTARAHASGAVLPGSGASGRLVVFGGGTASTQPASNTGGLYDLATDTWLPLPTDTCLPPPRWMHTTTVFGDGRRALVWGGTGNGLELPPEQGWVLTLDD
ncbi:MAG: hypothetical protein HS104_16645 [Polyangiaceae bacterium]|nr:hypothetical protein [Polyangiaceae bacterium]